MNSPNLDSEESCIQDTIAQFYSFFGRMVRLKDDIDRLMDLDAHTKNQILYQLEEIEREYKDSQEWFITRDVQDVRVGVVGTERSHKTAVVSLFVEGVLEIDGDEKDGRSKSKINVDGKCKLLLIREETGCPSKQLCQWADVLLLVFSYADVDSLFEINEFYRAFREVSQDAPVMLVGIKDDQIPLTRQVKEADIRKTVEMLDKCKAVDVSLTQQSTYTLFAQACRLALSNASFPLNFLTQCPIPPPSPSHAGPSSGGQTGGGGGAGGGGVNKYTAQYGIPVSPSHGKRSNKRRSVFGGKQQYNFAKQTPPAEYGSGRPVPIKDGSIKKKSGGVRAEWKKKYLVLSEAQLTYYPSLNDYMAQTHGKMLPLQQITVKVPGQRVSSVSRVTSTPPNNLSGSEFTESLTVTVSSLPGNQSDHSNSTSPPPNFESSLDMSYNSNTSGNGMAVRGKVQASPKIVHSSFPAHDYLGGSSRAYGHEIRDYRSPGSSERDDFGSSDHFDESYPGMNLISNGRGHNRNGSLDDNIMMLQQLRTGGISYVPVDEMGDRAATMSRIETKKMKKGGGFLTVVPGSSEEQLEGSQDSLLRGETKSEKKRRGDKDRNSMVLSDRSQSESAKDKSSYDKRVGKGHKRQRSWGGNKLLEVEASAEPPTESSEFQVISVDNKVWTFETGSAEEAASWVKTIEEQIKKIISESVSHKRVNSCNDLAKKDIISVEGNQFCADCNAPNPEWGSLNHGCLLCIECSGVHRNLGSHISRIRSLTLDEWSPELVSVMLKIGNKTSKNLWESKRPKLRPIYSSTREEREKFINAKYVDKEFLADIPRLDKSIPEQLMDAVKTDNIPNCVNILAHASPDDINKLHGPPEFWAPLHVACMLGRIVIAQLLIWNGGDINILDADKHSPLHYARSQGHQEIVQILIANSCEDTSDTSSVDVMQLPPPPPPPHPM